MDLVINEFLSNVRQHKRHLQLIVTTYQADVPIILKQVEKFLSGKSLYGLLAQINISLKSYDELFIDMGSICLKSYLKSLIMENYLKIFPLLSKQAHSDFQLLIKYFRQYQTYLKQNVSPELNQEYRLRVQPYLFNESLNSYFVFFLFGIVCNISKNFNVVNLYLNDESWIPVQPQEQEEDYDGSDIFNANKHNFKEKQFDSQQYHNDYMQNPQQQQQDLQQSTFLAPISTIPQDNAQNSLPAMDNVIQGIPFLPNPQIPLLQAELDSLKIQNETLQQQLQTLNKKQVTEAQSADKEILKLKKQLSTLETQYKQCLNEKNNSSLYKERLERQSREHQQLLGTNEELRKTAQNLKNKLSDVIDAFKSAKSEINHLQKENAELTSKNETLQKKLDRALSDNNGQEKVEATMDRELSRFKTQVLETQRKASEFKNELEKVTDKYEALQSTHDVAESKIKDLTAQLSQKQQQIIEMMTEQTQLKINLQKIMSTDEQVNQLKSELQIVNAELERQTEAARNMELLRARLEDAQTVKAEQKAQIDRLLNEMQKAQQVELDNKKLQIEIQRLNDAIQDKEKHIKELKDINQQQYDDLQVLEETRRRLAEVEAMRDEFANETKLYAQRNAYLTQRVQIIQTQFNKLRGLDAGINDINNTINQYAFPVDQSIQDQGRLNVIK